MSSPAFHAVDALRYAYSTVRAHPRELLSLGVTAFFLSAFGQLVSRSENGSAVFGLLLSLLNAAVFLLLVRASFKLFDGDAEVDLTTPAPFLAGYGWWVLLSMATGALISLGFALLVVPGVYAALRWGLAPMVFADEKLPFAQNFRRASALTLGHRFELLRLALLMLGVNLLGLLFFGVGVIVTVPMTVVAFVYALRRLEDRAPATNFGVWTPHVA